MPIETERMDIGSPEEEAIRQRWLNEDVAFENAQIEAAMEAEHTSTMSAHGFQNALRIMNSLDEVASVIGLERAAEFHRAPMEAVLRMDAPTFAKVFDLIEARQS